MGLNPLKSMIFFKVLVLLRIKGGQLLRAPYTSQPRRASGRYSLYSLASMAALKASCRLLEPVLRNSLGNAPDIPGPDQISVRIPLPSWRGHRGQPKFLSVAPTTRSRNFFPSTKGRRVESSTHDGVHVSPQESGDRRAGALEGNVGELHPGDHFDAQGGDMVVGPHARVAHLNFFRIGLGVTDVLLESSSRARPS